MTDRARVCVCLGLGEEKGGKGEGIFGSKCPCAPFRPVCKNSHVAVQESLFPTVRVHVYIVREAHLQTRERAFDSVQKGIQMHDHVLLFFSCMSSHSSGQCLCDVVVSSIDDSIGLPCALSVFVGCCFCLLERVGENVDPLEG